MRTILLSFTLSLATTVSSAQSVNSASGPDVGFQKGIRTLTIGYGYGTYSLFFQDIGGELDNLQLFGPMYFKLEFSHDNHNGLSINGAYIESHYEDNYYGHSVTSFQSLSINFKWNYHFFPQRRTDLYFSSGLGYSYLIREDVWYDDNDTTSTLRDKVFSVSFETTIGVRYYLSNQVAIYSEFGIAKSILQGGLTIGF